MRSEPDLPPFPELLNSHLSRRSFNEGGTISYQLRSSAGASRTSGKIDVSKLMTRKLRAMSLGL